MGMELASSRARVAEDFSELPLPNFIDKTERVYVDVTETLFKQSEPEECHLCCPICNRPKLLIVQERRNLAHSQKRNVETL
jgi:hypothetical protein